MDKIRISLSGSRVCLFDINVAMHSSTHIWHIQTLSIILAILPLLLIQKKVIVQCILRTGELPECLVLGEILLSY